MTDEPRIGLALGGGAARGWAHIGVIEALAEQGVRPQVVTGASIGALVGAALASGKLTELKDWVLGLHRLDVLRLLDASLSGGVIEGNRVMHAIEDIISDRDIEDLELPFGAAAADLHRGRTVWLREGSTIAAVRASCAMPGLFRPTRYRDAWLVDGGLVDPVPVTLCRMLGAEVVIAVNLSAYRHRLSPRPAQSRSDSIAETASRAAEERSYLDQLQQFVVGLFEKNDEDDEREPALLDVVSSSINIMQERVTRSRLAGDPPELEITPDVQEIGLMDFHRAGLAVERGRRAVEQRADELRFLVPDDA
ncbi:MAG: patatin-like phospholipase RssA [Gammaproteobacteria bacterium]|nr:patatin-like phospholipase RssA [Gammaproteobacteria bacterium]